MARSNDIQYVRYYTNGSAARELELPLKKKAPPKPKKRAAPQPVLKTDGLASVGTLVALVMLLCMVIGFVQVCHANQQVQALEVYVANLEAENESLKNEYARGYDLAQIRLAAESMGMVPVEQVRHITISVPEPEAEEELSWWQELVEDFKTLFA